MEAQYLSADPGLTSLTLVTTCLAAAAGGVVAALVSFLKYKNLDLTMFLNGILRRISWYYSWCRSNESN